MEASTFAALVLTCAPQVHLSTAQALVSVESAFNPWAIGVVGGALRRQPNNRDEALATAHQLLRDGRNFIAIYDTAGNLVFRLSPSE